jgi:hypothetical protein
MPNRIVVTDGWLGHSEAVPQESGPLGRRCAAPPATLNLPESYKAI